MKWSESIHPKEEDGVTTPTIKNHSVTYHDSHLYCFGGYDGRRNHQTLLLYSLKEKRWLHGPTNNSTVGGSRAEYCVRGAPPPGRNGHTATLALRGRGRRTVGGDVLGQMRDMSVASEVNDANHGDVGNNVNNLNPPNDENSVSSSNGSDSSAGPVPPLNHSNDGEEAPVNNPEILSPNNNNNPTYPNPNEIIQPPPINLDIPNEDEDAQIIIIGGWLGSGPLAASDTWILDISSGLQNLRWFQPPLRGEPPGPCNMHSADYIPSLSEVYVFRGGNGREYLNDLHALNVSTYTWRRVQTQGTPPQQRANHSSAVLSYPTKCELFIFGGWNGSERLNDIFILDTETNTWTEPRVGGIKPHPRAGMTLTALRGRLYLFGGSGTSSKCFDDLQILDRKDMAWLDVNDEKDGFVERNGSGYRDDAYDVNMWEGGSSLGGQDGMMEEEDGSRSVVKFSDWRSQENESGRQFSSGAACTSANPNDEDMVHSVFVTGSPPGKRAGHTATAVGRFIFVFGGSCGTDYLSDFFVLDTDPPPVVRITEPASPQLYARRLAHFYNDEEFADVIFIVEGKKVYGHKLVLSTVSDCFRAMFMTGFRESGSGCTEIEIPDTNYDIFLAMMEYIYTGKAPKINTSESDMGIDRAIALLELSDQFFLYNLKQICEGILQPVVNADTYSFLMSVAQKTNSAQLELYCRYFERNMNELVD